VHDEGAAAQRAHGFRPEEAVRVRDHTDARAAGPCRHALFVIHYAATTHDGGIAMAGKYYEELTVGLTFQHQPGRTVTESDNVLFSCLTMNPQPLHVDFHAASKAEFGKPLVNSLFTLGVVVGLSVGETTLGTTVGNLGFEKTEFPKPVFHGDTIYSETEVVDRRESKSRPQWGIVTFEHRGKNQHGDLVVRCVRQAMMRKKPA
jgi:acyl dehydratase